MLKRGNWSVGELSKLRACFARRPIEQLARELRRSEAAVRERARRSFARRTRPGRLDASDERLLAEMVGVATLADMALVLARTEDAIVAQLHAWHARRRSGRWAARDLQFLKDFGSKRPLWALELVTGRTAKVLEKRCLELCLGIDRTLVEVPLPGIAPDAPVSGSDAGPDRAEVERERTVVLSPARSRRMPRWSTADIERLRVLYPVRANLEVARMLGRSLKSVRAKAGQLGLRKTKDRLEAMGRENVRVRYQRDSRRS
ncbi:MAG: hypothetical protein H6832_18335 [Planctomycetes bacterium]|nr:hypothetical protein [Planctomycetota bacterium]MCB9920366.1 hypothetical protein [Planctomycetota bacterium]